MKRSKNYLITGATGFIGKNILKKIEKKDTKIYYIYRNKKLNFKNSNIIGIKVNLENLDEINKLKDILKTINTIIHCANLAHNKYSVNKIKKINYSATIYLAKLAKSFNIKKFIFLSTAKINMNYNNITNNENNISRNIIYDTYTKIKYETEIKINKIFKSSKVHCIILRPALVYGINVKGNLKKIETLAKFNLPLPFANATEKKSFCSINNLIKCINIILINKTKSNTFLVCDDDYLSFKDILIEAYKKNNNKIILFPIRLFIFRFIFYLIKKKEIYDSIFSRMILDNSKIKKELNIKLSHNLYNTDY
jgi:UDP-glucose 4-epimerase